MGPYPAGGGGEGALRSCRPSTPPGWPRATSPSACACSSSNLGLEDSPTDVMVRDHMKQLQSHQYAEIGRQMGLTPDEVSHHLEIIKRLDPKPGLKYSPDRSTYIIPDVFVVKEGDDYKIVLNDDGLPKLRISPTYRRMLDDKEAGLRGDAQLRQGQAAQRALAPEERGPAAAHDLQGLGVHRPPPARLPGPRHRAPAAAGAARRGHRHRHARVHRLAGGGQQVHAHPARASTSCASSSTAASPPTMGEAISSVTIKDKIRKMIEDEDAVPPALRLAHRRAAGRRRPAPGPAHGGQVPRGAAHPAVQPSQVGPLDGAPAGRAAGRWPHAGRVHRPADRGRPTSCAPWPSGSSRSWRKVAAAASPTPT